jgi:acetyl esterase/lipase
MRMLKFFGVALAAVLLIAAGFAAYWLLLDGRAPAKRPDLITLPDGFDAPPRGYPTQNAVIAAFVLGRLDILDIDAPVALPDGVRERLDVEYGRVGDRELLLDLYEPVHPAETPRPGIIFIHGGAWRGGNRSDYKYYTVRFADQGFVAATISYRFQQEAPFPAAVEDAKCAVRWMRANAEELGVDPDRIAVIGGSAGGYLALMTGYTAHLPELEGGGGHGEYSSRADAVINLYGPTDFTLPNVWHRNEVRNFLKAEWADDPDLWTLASPITHVTADIPPTLVIHGTIDTIVEVNQADRLVERMQEVGATHWYDRIDGYPHTMDVAPQINERVQALVHAFLDEHMPGGGATAVTAAANTASTATR